MRININQVHKELNRIANALERMSYTQMLELTCLDELANKISDMEFYIERIAEKRLPQYIQTGLSSICKNEYNLNMRLDETNHLIKQVFPDKKKKGRRNLDA